MLEKIRTVLIHNSHPGNIGASARALKNMGLSSLYLVAPKKFPAVEAIYMSSRAEDIVENAIVVENTPQALKDCTLVLGASSRTRALKWPEITPREAAAKIIDEIQKKEGVVAILYGCEQHGLSNEELELSHYQIVIPAVSDYASLNVSQAVQLISYEVYVAYLSYLENMENIKIAGNQEKEYLDNIENLGWECVAKESDKNVFPPHKDNRYATFEEMEGFFKHLEETLIKINFTDDLNASHLMSRLRRLFGAARPDTIEVNILRGILRNVLTSVQKKGSVSAPQKESINTERKELVERKELAEKLTRELINIHAFRDAHVLGHQANNSFRESEEDNDSVGESKGICHDLS